MTDNGPVVANVLLDGVVELDLKSDLDFDAKMNEAQKIQREQIEEARRKAKRKRKRKTPKRRPNKQYSRTGRLPVRFPSQPPPNCLFAESRAPRGFLILP